MDRLALAHWRMHNLGFSAPSATAEEVVHRLGAVQSQDFAPGKWSVAQRTAVLGDVEVSRAFDQGRFVRTHVLRPTWHFVASEDIRWMLELTGPRVLAKEAGRYRQLGLDDELLARCRHLLQEALIEVGDMTRRDVRALLQEQGVSLEDNRFAHILMNAELHAVICSGPVKENQQTYSLLDTRCTDQRELGRTEALAELTRRYFSSHGPATLKDFGWWSGLTLTEIRRGIELLQEVQKTEVEGLPYYFVGNPPEGEVSRPQAHLLQTFDEYVVGYTESRSVMDLAGLAGAVPNRSPGVIIVNTQLVGHWRRKMDGEHVDIQLMLLRELKATEKAALQEAVDRFATFVGRAPRIITRASGL